MDNTAIILWGLIFGSIGMGFLMYGKKQKNYVALASGIGLIIYPYFITNVYLVILIGIGLMAMPYFLRDI